MSGSEIVRGSNEPPPPVHVDPDALERARTFCDRFMAVSSDSAQVMLTLAGTLLGSVHPLQAEEVERELERLFTMRDLMRVRVPDVKLEIVAGSFYKRPYEARLSWSSGGFARRNEAFVTQIKAYEFVAMLRHLFASSAHRVGASAEMPSGA